MENNFNFKPYFDTIDEMGEMHNKLKPKLLGKGKYDFRKEINKWIKELDVYTAETRKGKINEVQGKIIKNYIKKWEDKLYERIE